jgi:AcrR family transcriptional regulator
MVVMLVSPVLAHSAEPDYQAEGGSRLFAEAASVSQGARRMNSDETPPPLAPRKPRADAARNRERLIDAAKAAFSQVGPDVGLEEIARRAGLGIGTLYRHFPTREAVVGAVYRREVQQLADAADRLLDEQGPAEALHRWMHMMVDYIATKRLIAPALTAIAAGGSDVTTTAWPRITAAFETLVRRAAQSGQIRDDIAPDDLLRALAGVSFSNAAPGWEASARRLVDVLMDGLRKV